MLFQPLYSNDIVYLIRTQKEDLSNNLFKRADFSQTEVIWNHAWEPNMWTTVKKCLAKRSNYTLKTTVATKDNRKELDKELKDAKWIIDSSTDLSFSGSLDPKKEFDAELLKKTIIIIFESPVICPKHWDRSYHDKVAKVLTWNDSLVDNKKYFLVHWHFYSDDKLTEFIPFTKRNKLCCLIGEGYDNKLPKELYSQRRIEVDYFEKQHPDDFDFYGYRWSSRAKYKTFKGGFWGGKKAVLKNYKFCLAYENMRDVDGWITERIFNCFEAGCVPVYWGARNIKKYVPENCFIDREKFANINDLYNFMKNMPEAEYLQYLKNIQLFLNSDLSKEFSLEQFADRVTTAILA